MILLLPLPLLAPLTVDFNSASSSLSNWIKGAVASVGAKTLRLNTSALADLPGSGSAGQLVYFSLT